MEKVNWPDNIRVDGPDLRAVLDLVEAHFVASKSPIYGQDGSTIHAGVIGGMSLLVDVGLPVPLEAAIVTSGTFQDGARRYIEHTGTTSLDLSAVAGTAGATIWARVSPTQLEATQEDRVYNVSGTETTTPSYTRLLDQIEFTATTGSTPAGDGWALAITVDSWTTYEGVTVPQVYTRNLVWLGYGSLYLLAAAIRSEIAEIKGVADSSWTSAPTQTIPQIVTRLAAAETTIANALVKGAAKASAWVEVSGGVAALVSGRPAWNVASVTYVGFGVYDVNLSPSAVAESLVLEQSQVSSAGNTTIGWDFLCTYTYSGGILTKVRIEAFDDAGDAAEADAFRVLIV